MEDAIKLDPEKLAEMIVTTIVKAIDGPKVGGRLAQLEARIAHLEARPLQKWAGVHVTSMQYGEASLVTRGGSLWVATAPTTSTPGETGGDWRLIVKRGIHDEDTAIEFGV